MLNNFTLERMALLFVLAFGTLPVTLAENPPAPATSIALARSAIRRLNHKEEIACRNMDNDATAKLWADDGVDLIQGMPPMVGKAAIVKWYESLKPQLRGAKMEYCTIDWRQQKIEGNWAWEWAVTRQKIDPPAPHKPFESEGKMLLILKRQPSGEWKIELESWNSEPPKKK